MESERHDREFEERMYVELSLLEDVDRGKEKRREDSNVEKPKYPLGGVRVLPRRLCNCVAQRRHVTNPATEVQRVSEEREANRTGKVLSESCSNHQGQASGVRRRGEGHSLTVCLASWDTSRRPQFSQQRVPMAAQVR